MARRLSRDAMTMRSGADDLATFAMFFEYRKRATAARSPRLWLAILAWLPGALCAAEGAALLPARDLARDGRDMNARKLPMMVLYSQANCAWCERARREYLIPMQRDPAYRDKVVLRQIDIDSDAPLTDFSGQATTHRAFGKAQNARVAPTILVYGPTGERLSEPIVGFRIPDFYGAYLERSIDEGLAMLHRSEK